MAVVVQTKHRLKLNFEKLRARLTKLRIKSTNLGGNNKTCVTALAINCTSFENETKLAIQLKQLNANANDSCLF